MKKHRLLLCVVTALLAACGGDNNKMTHAEAQQNWHQPELYYSFPYKGQANLSLNTPLVLRFADALTEDFDAEQIKLYCEAGVCKEEVGQELVNWSADEPNLIDDRRGVMLKPARELIANSTYCVVLDEVPSGKGSVVDIADFCFDTAIAATKRGSLKELGVADALTVVGMIPDLAQPDALPIMDFSTYRLRFNEPLDAQAIRYGEHVQLLENGEEVKNVTLIANHNVMTVHPPKLLSPEKSYELVLDEVPALYGSLGNDEKKTFSETYSFKVLDSEPRTILIQDTVQASAATEDPCAPSNEPLLSPLSDQPLNCVPLDSLVLGNKDSTMQSGDVFAELAYLPRYPDVSPLRVPRGSLLSGTNIKVKLAGSVPAATDGSMDTGEVSVSFLSDAVGYIFPNPYSTDPKAPKQVRLFMDVAMTAEGAVPNAALSQNLLHVELNGMASLEGKSMRIDALGVVEPDVLGVEKAFGFLSFQMKSYEQDEFAALFEEQKQTIIDAPKVTTRFPYVENDGDEAPSFQPGDAITINFDKPLDPRTIRYGETLFLAKDGAELLAEEVHWYMDGASVVVKHVGGFESEAEYQVRLTEEITGLPKANIIKADNNSENGEDDGWRGRHYFAEEGEPGTGAPIAEEVFSFTLPLYDSAEAFDREYAGGLAKEDAFPFFRYPVVLAANPGYPCALSEPDSNGESVCLGDEGQNGNAAVKFKPQHIPSNRPITLTFSKAMQSIPQGGFEVFKVAESGDVPVNIEIQQNEFGLTAIPEKPWEVGQLYKYVMKSGCGEGLCGKNGYRLMTAPLGVQEGDETNAFPDSVVYFQGVEKQETVFLTLRNTPTLDTAGVMTYYPEMLENAIKRLTAAVKAKPEQEPDGWIGEENPKIPNSAYLEVGGVSGIVTGAEQPRCQEEGCDQGRKNAFAYLNKVGTLSTEMFGSAIYRCVYQENSNKCGDEDTGDVALLVGIYPTVIMAGSADLVATVLGVVELATPTGLQTLRMQPGEPDAFAKLLAEGDPLLEHPLIKDNPNGLIPGWIRLDKVTGKPVFEIKTDIYLDAPYLALSLEEIVDSSAQDLVGDIPVVGDLVNLICTIPIPLLCKTDGNPVSDAVGALVGAVEGLIGMATGGEALGHNLRNYPLKDLELIGPVEFMEDGRILIHQSNLSEKEINVSIKAAVLEGAGVISLSLPPHGVYLTYEGEPVKK